MSARGTGETTTAERRAAGAEPGGGPLWRLLNGQTNIDFVGRSRLWLWVVVASAAVCLGALAARGVNFNLDFTGGTAFTVSGATRPFTSAGIGDALGEIGVRDTKVQVVDDGRGALVSTPALDEIGGQQQRAVVARLSEVTGASAEQIDVSAVGPRWGAQITRQALRGLVVFLVLIGVYISLRFDWRMAAAALVTLLHDILVTVGVYALVGFEVSPASVIAFLTILGYSLYDTVVVFDRVTEDTQRLSSVSTVTYGQSANRALNEVLVRSLSTSATSVLPVGSLLFIGVNLLGADTLQDLALALFVGMAVGTYSSIIVATPFLVWLKEKEPRYAELKQRLAVRRGGPGRGGGRRR
ncbi:MAG TPA: protein translocase subunit SecF [Egibacteraceae bacterium]|nr:protein translocase subunit SecF [Egibacteraceae bacterium]